VKKIIFASFLPTLLFFSGFVFTQQNNSLQASDVQAVSSVDLKRYAGKWFEISSYPNKAQKNCVGNTITTLTQKVEGYIAILNHCVTKNGTTQSTKTEAKVADKTTNAKFEMQSAPRNYWIIDLDPDYKYAAVADPKREYLWILSREPEINDTVYQNILRRVEKMGFNPGKLIKTPQKVEVIKGSVIEKQ